MEAEGVKCNHNIRGSLKRRTEFALSLNFVIHVVCMQ